MTLVDAHVHLPEYLHMDELLRSTPNVFMFSCTVNPGQVTANLRLRDEAGGSVKSFVGVHPSDVTETLPSVLLSESGARADGIGEIGLDPKYSDAGPGSKQMRAFLDQLALAESLGKPVQVHTRGSEQACLDALATFRLPSVLLHWFEGDEGQVQTAASRGYYFSLGPALLYSKKLRRTLENIPLDRTLTESDGPVTFGPLGGASGPNLVASVLFRIGEIRGIPFEEAERTVEESARRYLRAES